MTTTVTKTIGSAAGRDYPTYAAWKAYVEGRGDLTTAGVDEIHIGQMWNDSVFVEATLAMPTNTRDAAHPVTLQCGPGQSFRDAKSALRYNEANGVAIQLTATSGSLIGNTSFSKVYGIQLKNTAVMSTASFGLTGVVFDSCIVDFGATTSGNLFGTNSAVVFRNSIAVTRGIASYWAGTSNALVALFEGSTLVKIASGNMNNAITNSTGGRAIFRDCVFLGQNGVSVTGANAGPTFTNLASDGPISQGTNNQATITPSASFVNATSDAALDLRLISGAFLSGKGVASGTLTVDIFGSARPSPPSIGAHEYIAAGILYTQTISASTTAGAFAVRGPAAVRSAAIATMSSMTRVASSMRIASLTTAALLSKLAKESKAAATATAATVSKAQATARAATATTAIVPSVSRFAFVSRSATSALVGAAARAVLAPRRTTMATSASVSRVGSRAFLGATTPVTTLTKIVSLFRLAAPQPPVNVALQGNGGVASAINTYPGFYESNANDGNESSGGFWNNLNQGEYPVWWQVTLAQGTLIDQVNVWTLSDRSTSTPTINATPVGPDGLVSFDVQVYNGATWTTVGSITNNQYAGNSFVFAPLPATVVRVTVYQGGNYQGNYARLFECEVYSVPGGMQAALTTKAAKNRIFAAVVGCGALVSRSLSLSRSATTSTLASVTTVFTSGVRSFARTIAATSSVLAGAASSVARYRVLSTILTTAGTVVRSLFVVRAGGSGSAATLAALASMRQRSVVASTAPIASSQGIVAAARSGTATTVGTSTRTTEGVRMASSRAIASASTMLITLRGLFAASTSAGVLTRSIAGSRSAVAAIAASLVRAPLAVGRTVGAATMSSASAVRAVAVARLGSSAPIGAIVRQVQPSRAASSALAASSSAQVAYLRVVGGTSAMVAVARRGVFSTRASLSAMATQLQTQVAGAAVTYYRTVVAGLASTAVLTRATSFARRATVAAIGSRSVSLPRRLVANVNATGAAVLVRLAGFASATISASTAAIGATRRGVVLARSTVLGMPASLNRATTRVLAGASGIGGVMAKRFSALVGAAQATVGNLATLRIIQHALAAAAAALASIRAGRVVTVSGSMVATGVTVRAIAIVRRGSAAIRGVLSWLGFGGAQPIVCAHWQLSTRSSAVQFSTRQATVQFAQRQATWTFTGCSE